MNKQINLKSLYLAKVQKLDAYDLDDFEAQNMEGNKMQPQGIDDEQGDWMTQQVWDTQAFYEAQNTQEFIDKVKKGAELKNQ